MLAICIQPSDVKGVPAPCLQVRLGVKLERDWERRKVQELRREARNILMLSVLSFELGLICEGNGVLIGGTLK